MLGRQPHTENVFSFLSENSNIVIKYLTEVSFQHVSMAKFFRESSGTKRLFCESIYVKKCDFRCTSKSIDEHNVFDLKFPSATAFICSGDKVFFVDKDKKSFIQRTLNKDDLQKLQKITKNKKTIKKLPLETLEAISALIKCDYKSTYQKLHEMLMSDCVTDEFAKMMHAWHPETEGAEEAFKSIKAFAERLFEPILKNTAWLPYWETQCNLIKAKHVENKEAAAAEINSVYSKIVGAFCYKISLLWSTKYTNAVLPRHLVDNMQILAKILHQPTIDAFIKACEKEMRAEATRYFHQLTHDVIRTREKKKDNNLCAQMQSPTEHLYYNLLDNAEEIVRDCFEQNELEIQQQRKLEIEKLFAHKKKIPSLLQMRKSDSAITENKGRGQRVRAKTPGLRSLTFPLITTDLILSKEGDPVLTPNNTTTSTRSETHSPSMDSGSSSFSDSRSRVASKNPSVYLGASAPMLGLFHEAKSTSSTKNSEGSIGLDKTTKADSSESSEQYTLVVASSKHAKQIPAHSVATFNLFVVKKTKHAEPQIPMSQGSIPTFKYGTDSQSEG